MPRALLLWLLLGAAADGVAQDTAEAPALAKSAPPNVVLILADDLGYSDLGCQGGEIHTPHLDGLAAAGLRYTQFYDTGRCWPSRAAIMTGYYAQAVRRDRVPGVASGTPGTRPPWARLLPELLRARGYRNYHSGKWHLDGQPLANGFDHSYSLDDHDRHFAPRQHREDGKRLPAVPEGSGYYSSTAIVDHAIAQLREHAATRAGQPFFAFVAFTAPHFPLQAPASDIARYAGVYRRGWDMLREQRWSRMQALGLGGSALAPIEREVGPPYDFPAALLSLGALEINRPLPWRDLGEQRREFQAAKMAVHAAMVDRLDQEVGRLLAQLDAMQATANTVVMFLSDNGASAEMMVRGDGHDPTAPAGSAKTFLSLGPGWSSLANTPFRRHKTWTHEGGIATPFLLRWPAGIAARGELRHAPAHVVDLLPTILALAEVDRDPAAPAGHGTSLLPTFATDAPLPRTDLWWQHEGNRAFRRGDWKIVAAGENSAWELYDLTSDRSETADLAAKMPDKVKELATAWQRQTDACIELATRDRPPAKAGK
ncbi:MAG: arylsulfatase [Planctomycetes bacterium]|nr:arylsulfatase [Planctomycetota bacterium]